MTIKNITAICWLIASCIFLWLFSLAQGKGMSNPPKAIELFDSFFLFSFMLVGGGGCFHFFTELLSTPYSEETKQDWLELMKSMILLMLLAISGPIAILCIRYFSNDIPGMLLSIVYLFICFCLSSIPGSKIEKLFKKISSNHAVQGTARASRL